MWHRQEKVPVMCAQPEGPFPFLSEAHRERFSFQFEMWASNHQLPPFIWGDSRLLHYIEIGWCQEHPFNIEFLFSLLSLQVSFAFSSENDNELGMYSMDLKHLENLPKLTVDYLSIALYWQTTGTYWESPFLRHWSKLTTHIIKGFFLQPNLCAIFRTTLRY